MDRFAVLSDSAAVCRHWLGAWNWPNWCVRCADYRWNSSWPRLGAAYIVLHGSRAIINWDGGTNIAAYFLRREARFALGG
jgi:hypothetical protein